MVAAAAEKAERVIAEHAYTLVPSDYFDRLLESLDEPAEPMPQTGRGRSQRARASALPPGLSSIPAVYLSQRITGRHEQAGFACGDQTLDHWLAGAALTADVMGTARTYVWTEENVVVGYFSLWPHEVRRDELPSKLSHGGPHSIPAILLARLALDRGLHGQGLGASLLLDALGRATDAIEIAGGRLILVDAIDDSARRFYEHHGFRAAPTRPARLFRKASDVASALRAG